MKKRREENSVKNKALSPRKPEVQFNSQSPKGVLMSLSWPEVTFGRLFPGCRLYIRKEDPHLGPLKPYTVRGVTSGL